MNEVGVEIEVGHATGTEDEIVIEIEERAGGERGGEEKRTKL